VGPGGVGDSLSGDMRYHYKTQGRQMGAAFGSAQLRKNDFLGGSMLPKNATPGPGRCAAHTYVYIHTYIRPAGVPHILRFAEVLFTAAVLGMVMVRMMIKL